MTWEKIETKAGQNGTRNPYEAWDTLGLENVRAEETLFQPVYVQLKKDPATETYVQSASDLLKALNLEEPAERILAPDSTVRMLKRLAQKEAILTAGKVFVYRLAQNAYSTDVNGQGDIIADVLHVGPVIPGRKVPKGGPRDVGLPVIEKSSGLLPVPVLTAVIDDEIGFLNGRFRATAERTRIKRFWSMGLERLQGAQGQPVTFGAVLDDNDIDGTYLPMAAHLGEAAAYAHFDSHSAGPASGKPLQSGRFRDPAFRRPRGLVASHGTAVLDLAAGRPAEVTSSPHPTDPILAVELPQLATADTSGGWLDAYVLQSVIEVMDWADNIPTSAEDTEERVTSKPLVINLSYGINAGPKDGSGFLAHHLSELVEQRNSYAPTWIVLPAGNSYLARGRAELDIDARDKPQDLVWEIPPDDASPSFLEIYLHGAAALTCTAPGATAQVVPVAPAAQGEWRYLSDDGTATMAIYAQPHGTGSRVTWAVAPTRPNSAQNDALSPSGEYRLRIAATVDKVTGSVEVQRDDTPSGYQTGARQSVLTLGNGNGFDLRPETGSYAPRPPLTQMGTLSDYATAQNANIFVVAGAEQVLPSGKVKAARYSCAGTAQIHPDLSNLCEDGRRQKGVLASGLYSGSSVAFGGTSMAAARVTRQLVEALRGDADLDKATFLAGQDGLKAPVPHDERQRLGVKVTGRPDLRRVRA